MLESPFLSLADIAAHHYPWLPTRWIAAGRFRTKEFIGELNVPKLFVHARGDEIIPFEQGEALYAKAAEPKSWLAIDGDHNGGFLTSASAYTAGVAAFLEKHLP